jgi:uncharacterized repeat protein (TIGR03803 family)
MNTRINRLFLLPALITGLGLLLAGRVAAQTIFTTLHSFSGSDGSGPAGGLRFSGDTLYGTAYSGGGLSRGTVFAVNTDGSGFRTVHAFDGDGVNPNTTLLVVGDTM